MVLTRRSYGASRARSMVTCSMVDCRFDRGVKCVYEGIWSKGMILAVGARGLRFDPRNPFYHSRDCSELVWYNLESAVQILCCDGNRTYFTVR